MTASQILLMAALSLVAPMLYHDATCHRIGKHPAIGHSLSAGTWAAWAMIPPLAGLFFIAYLVNRPTMIRRARQYPVTVPRTRRVATFFLLLAASSVLVPYWWLVVATYPDPS